MHHRSPLLALTLLLLGLQTPVSMAAPTAKAFLNGGTFCFKVGEPIPGGWDTRIKLISQHARGSAPSVVSVVSGRYTGFKATYPPQSYTSELVGSATIATPNDAIQAPSELAIGLSSSDYGSDASSPNSGIWTGQYVLNLNTGDLKGQLTAKKHFTPIVDGKPPIETYSESISQTVKPIDCKGM